MVLCLAILWNIVRKEKDMRGFFTIFSLCYNDFTLISLGSWATFYRVLLSVGAPRGEDGLLWNVIWDYRSISQINTLQFSQLTRWLLCPLDIRKISIRWRSERCGKWDEMMKMILVEMSISLGKLKPKMWITIRIRKIVHFSIITSMITEKNFPTFLSWRDWKHI